MASILKVDTIQNQNGNNIINESGDTITIGASGDTIAIPSGASMSGFTSTGIDDNADATAITIDSSENVGIGTASPSEKLEVSGNIKFGDGHTIGNDASDNLEIKTSTGEDIYYKAAGGLHIWEDTGGTEYMRFYGASRSLMIGKTSNGLVGTQGAELGWGNGGALLTQTNNSVLQCNRLTSDGDLVLFRQDTTVEGSITVSGAAVSYNGFTGTHWSRFTDNSKSSILKGTVLESLDEMCDWYNLEFNVTDAEGNTYTEKVPHVLADGQSVGDVINYNHEGTDYQATIVKEADIKHMKSKVSDTVDAKNVYGVFVAYDEDGEGYNDFYVASVGSFVVRIKANETIAKGDLLQSNGDGTAKVQTDDAVRSSSFAKVLSTTVIETYEDGSYLVPCSLMC